MNSKTNQLEWEKKRDGFRLFTRGVTLRTCFPIAIVVGIILSGINQSEVLLNGLATNSTWVKVIMNFIVPFCVSSYGFLNARRVMPSINK